MVDHNVGKLARWLRMMGYDSLFFDRGDDTEMVRRALSEGRVLLTRDRGIMQRRVVKNGRLKAVLLESEDPERQMQQLLSAYDLPGRMRPFTLCLECNGALEPRDKEALKDRLPPHVYKTQRDFMECPACGRLYWRGTHWEAMMRRLAAFRGYAGDWKDD
jgi:uncharacterized protein with PIN domain